ncbi:MAG: rhodanese-like domain-containing protein, partial [Hyphomicrobium sp.]
DAHAKALAGELVLVDVRTPNEWLETGIPASGHSITMHQDPNVFLAQLLDKMDNDKTRPVAIICRTGARTTMLQGQLKQIGFTNVLNVVEGMLGGFAGPGWRKTGLPTRMPGEPVQTGAAAAKS